MSGRLRSPCPGTLFSGAAFLATLCFLIGMGLWGTSAEAGYFYVASIIVGTPLLLAMKPWNATLPRAIRLYAALYVGFLIMCIVHVWFRGASTGTIEYAARFLIGLINGLFFYHLVGQDRQALFRLIVLVAGAHWAVAVAYTIYAGVDFKQLSIVGGRVGGNTSPISYSMLFITSAGILALSLADRIRPEAKRLPLTGIVIVLGATTLAATISGSRGTLITMPLLVLLVFALLWMRIGLKWGLGIAAVGGVLLLASAYAVFGRDPHMWTTLWGYLFGDPDELQYYSGTSVRYELWAAAISLIPEQLLFGHGISSVPEVLRHPAAGLPEGSQLLYYGHIHNEYLDLLLKTGLVGFVLFYAPMVVALWLAIKRLANPAHHLWALVVMWVVGAQLIYGVTSVMFAHASTILQFGVYLGMLVFVVAGDEKQPVATR